MSEYTPTQNEVAEAYAWWHLEQEDGSLGIPVPESKASFRRMIAEVERAAAEEALERFGDTLGVNIREGDSEWQKGYRQAQRRALLQLARFSDENYLREETE